MSSVSFHIIYRYLHNLTETEKNIILNYKCMIYFCGGTDKEKYLNIRTFTDSQKRDAYERQKGVCQKCNGQFTLSEMQADHITPWIKGGKTISANCQMFCTIVIKGKVESSFLKIYFA